MGTEILTWWEKFKLNLAHWYGFAQTWVLGMWGVAYAYWTLGMTDADHVAFYALMPFGIGKLGPLIAFAVSYIAAHGWPQPALEQKLAVSAEIAVDKAIARSSGPV